MELSPTFYLFASDSRNRQELANTDGPSVLLTFLRWVHAQNYAKISQVYLEPSRDQIPGSLGHEKCLKQISEYSKKKGSSFRRSANQKLIWLKDLINEGPFYVCVVCQRCLHKIKSIFCYDENKFENTLQTSNFNLVRSSDGNLYNCTTFQVKNQKYKIPYLADESKLKAFDFH